MIVMVCLKTESNQNVIDNIRPGAYVASIHLKHAFYSIPILNIKNNVPLITNIQNSVNVPLITNIQNSVNEESFNQKTT